MHYKGTGYTLFHVSCASSQSCDVKVVRTKVVRIFNLTLIRFCDIFEAFLEQLITHNMVNELKFFKESYTRHQQKIMMCIIFVFKIQTENHYHYKVNAANGSRMSVTVARASFTASTMPAARQPVRMICFPKSSRALQLCDT